MTPFARGLHELGGMGAWDAARDIALGEFAGLGERGRVAVNVEAVYRALDPAHRSPGIVELFNGCRPWSARAPDRPHGAAASRGKAAE